MDEEYTITDEKLTAVTDLYNEQVDPGATDDLIRTEICAPWNEGAEHQEWIDDAEPQEIVDWLASFVQPRERGIDEETSVYQHSSSNREFDSVSEMLQDVVVELCDYVLEAIQDDGEWPVFSDDLSMCEVAGDSGRFRLISVPEANEPQCGCCGGQAWIETIRAYAAGNVAYGEWEQ